MQRRDGSPLKRQPLTRVQRSTFIACFLGWSLDAFDYFLLTLCLRSVAATFHVGLAAAAEATFWTLAMRPVGALLFGWMAERYGRRPTLMLNVVAFSIFELASAFAPTLPVFLVCRALFGVAMGGEWGVGAALALEVLPPERRGFFSGLLQEGYVVGNLLAAALFGVLFPHLHGIGVFAPWRVLFMIGALPALLAFYLRLQVKESPAWLAARARKISAGNSASRSGSVTTPAGIPPSPTQRKRLWRYLPSLCFLALLMTAFTAFSHGTQDLYPSFLERDRGFGASVVGLLTVIGNLGAIAGGVVCGTLSERFGRRRTIIVAALLAIPMIPLWSAGSSPLLLALGGFLMQFMVQGAWGVIPAHLNELSPAPMRAIFPGFAYQLGNLLSSKNNVLQATIATSDFGGRLSPVLARTVILAAILVAGLTALGREAKGSSLTEGSIEDLS